MIGFGHNLAAGEVLTDASSTAEQHELRVIGLGLLLESCGNSFPADRLNFGIEDDYIRVAAARELESLLGLRCQ